MSPPIRVLHVVSEMRRGGVETWLLNVLHRIDRDRYHLDFAVHTSSPAAYDGEIQRMGSRIYRSLDPSHPITYARSLSRVMRSEAGYDIVHSHVHHFSGYVLLIARLAGIPGRIAHSHVDASGLAAPPGRNPALRSAYLASSAQMINWCSTAGLAVSRQAARDLFGRNWELDPRIRILYCGIDLAPYKIPVSRSIRSAIGLPDHACVFGHVGNFREQKNHEFLVRIAAALVQQDPRAHLLLVGDGPLREDVERQVRQAGLPERVTFLGTRPDVPDILLGAMNAFVMPSLYEGLPLAALEAQAAGLPIVMTDTITPEVEVVPGLVHRMPLSEPPEEWAQAALRAAAAGPPVEQAEAVDIMEDSPFNICASVSELEKIYDRSRSLERS